MRRRGFRIATAAACAALALIAAAATPRPATASSKDVLALERAQVGDFCTRAEFESGYLTRVDANGDDIPDYLANTGRLICNGSRMAFCGTGGCSHRVWVGRRDGGWDLGYEGLIFDIRFDRPNEGSFVVTTRSGERRERLTAVPSPVPE